MAEPASLDGWLDIIADRLALDWPPGSKEQLLCFLNSVKKANTSFNLTRITGDEDMAVRHVLDSLTLLPYLDKQAGLLDSSRRPQLIDVGSGAGFPGVPLKLLRSGWSVVLMDALAKRVGFLKDVVDTMGLEAVEPWHGRAEDAGRDPDKRERFDAAVARAVAPLAVLAEYCLPLVRVGGVFLAMKASLDDEWPAAKRAITLLGGHMEQLDVFVLPGTEIHRSVCVIRKKKPTPQAYPRRPGLPAKRPL